MRALISGEGGVVGILGESPRLLSLTDPAVTLSNDSEVHLVFALLNDRRFVEVQSETEALRLCREAWIIDRIVRLSLLQKVDETEPEDREEMRAAVVALRRTSDQRVVKSADILLMKLKGSAEETSTSLNAPVVESRGGEILMPKATAVWLVDNTALSFEQIADFCGLHPVEVRGIADGDVARDIRGVDPITGGQLTRVELEKAQEDVDYRMKAVVSRHAELLKTHKPAPKYTPVSRRQDRPDAIMWFVKNHPEVTDATIAKLLGTTKSTIDSVRNRTHWNSHNIKAVDPVTLGLVGQLVLDEIIAHAMRRAAAQGQRGLLPAPPARLVEEAPRSATESAPDGAMWESWKLDTT